MKILVARLVNGRWQKLMVVRAAKSTGRIWRMADKWLGTLDEHYTRRAAAYFAAEPAAREYEIVVGVYRFRFTRFA